MKNKEKVIIKFQDKKYRNKVIFSRKELKLKGEQLRDLQFGPSLFINDSMYFDSDSPSFYKCRKLKILANYFLFGFSVTHLMLNLLKRVPLQKSSTSLTLRIYYRLVVLKNCLIIQHIKFNVLLELSLFIIHQLFLIFCASHKF